MAATVCSLAALLGAPEGAAAKENGVKVGEGRLHPFFEFEARFDSLAGYIGQDPPPTAPPGTPSTLRPVGDLILHYRPGITLDVPSDTFALTMNGNVDYNQFLGLQEPGSAEQSFIAGDLDIGGTGNPQGSVLVHVGDHFSRSNRTTLAALGVGTINDFNEARLRIGIQPGGKALLIEPGYTLTYEHFETTNVVLPVGCDAGNPTCDPNIANAFDYLTHTAILNARWKFLPKTAIVIDSSLGYRGYLAPQTQDFGTANLKVAGGLVGLVAPKVAVTLKAGWGDQLAGTGLKTVIGQGELAYLMSEQASVRLGYVRTYEPNPSATPYYLDDRGYTEARFLLFGRLSLHGNASYDYVQFGTERFDQQIGLGAGPDFQVTSWFDTGLGYSYSQRISSIDLVGFDYNRQEVFGRLRFIY